ncbi:MAG: hypothetical protein EOM40_17755 [Clostridia bacterium]|nr:hypothetical protein [Clostridia bacterium]
MRELNKMPYFIKPFYISYEDAEKIRKEDEAMFMRAAITALGVDVFRKYNFTVRFAEIFETEKGPNIDNEQ